MPNPSTVMMDEDLETSGSGSDEVRFAERVRELQASIDLSVQHVEALKEDLQASREELRTKQKALGDFIRSWKDSKLELFDNPSPQEVAGQKPQGWRSTLITSLGMPDDIVANLHDADIATLGGVEFFLTDGRVPFSSRENLKPEVFQTETLKRYLREVPELMESLKEKGIEL